MKAPFNPHHAGNLLISCLLLSYGLASCSKMETLESNDPHQELPLAASSTTNTSTGTITNTVSRLAFPNATGFAKTCRGAYAKYEATRNPADLPKILYVDNLNDHGPGSLREALFNTSPRIIIFRTSGTINLYSTLDIKYPYVTIAGYTAPGGGICIRGATLSIQTSYVIIRNIRSRNGVWAAPDHGTDGIGISAEWRHLTEIMIDHCSVSWASDEQIGINGHKGGIENVTIQNCIIAEGFLGHAYGILCYGKLGDVYHIKNVSIHRNLFENLEGRTPRFGEYTTGSVINNLVHNWIDKSSQYTDYNIGDVLYNKFKTGKNTTATGVRKAIELVWDGTYYKAHMNITGNMTAGQYTCVSEYPSGSGGLKALAASTYYNSTIYGFTPVTYFTELENELLPSVGAFPRDAADARFVNQYRYGTGSIPTRAGTYPILARGLYPTNNNGVSLAWLVRKGYATTTNAAAALTAIYLLDPAKGKTGYSIIEEYINDETLVK